MTLPTQSGKIKYDDLHTSLQQGFINDRQALAGPGQSGFVGFGFNPLGAVKRLDDNDPAIQYSVGDWSKSTGYIGGMEGLSNSNIQTTNIGAWCQVSFVGTGLTLNTFNVTNSPIISVSIDGGTPTTIDLYNSGVGSYGRYFALASGLSYGAHTVKITMSGKNSAITGISYLRINYFDVLAPDDNKVRLARDAQWNKSSAFIGGYRVDATTDLTQTVNDITNLIPNASFERISPTWGTVFQDDFNRADGSVGNGWIQSSGTSSTISSNTLSVSGNRLTNGDTNWINRQIRFLFTAVAGASIYIHIKFVDDLNFIRGQITTASSGTNLSFGKYVGNANTSLTGSSQTGSMTITAGTTYYVTARAEGNLYTLSVATGSDYTTGATTIYAYDTTFTNGKFCIEAQPSTTQTVDNVVVTAPIPDALSFGGNNGIVNSISTANRSIKTIANGLSVSNGMYSNSSQQRIPVVAGQSYAFRAKRKITQSFTGNGTRLAIDWYNASNTYISSTLDIFSTASDSNFIEVILNATAPTGATTAYPNFVIDGVGTVEWKEPMFVNGTYLSGQLQFYTKESRCDLICLQNDGQVVTTQGTGTSELGYRVEAEDGSISTFWRDKRTVQHWDRAKVWKNGFTGNPAASASASNAAYLASTTTNDAIYISFVGTGIDVIVAASFDHAIIGVTIDNGTEFFIDEYMPSTTFGVKFQLARNLSYGQHIIKMRHTGTKNGLVTASPIYFCPDAFDIYVPAIPVCPSPTTMLPVSAVIKADPDYGWIRYEDNEGVLYSGTGWTLNSGGTYSGGSGSYSGTTNDYAEFTFIGTGIVVNSLKNSGQGIAEVTIDSLSPTTVDMYSSTSFSAIMWQGNLAFGQHKIKLRVTGNKNTSATNTSLFVDAFDIKNTMYVIDLRKNQGQVMVETAITNHEAKDLWDAHPQAIKGDVNKLRIEGTGYGASSNTLTIATAGTRATASINFARTFTVKPRVKAWITNFATADAGYITVTIVDSLITTTGFQIYVNSYLAQGVSIQWEAIGY